MKLLRKSGKIVNIQCTNYLSQNYAMIFSTLDHRVEFHKIHFSLVSAYHNSRRYCLIKIL